jgi:hypothetical protein
MEKVGNLLCLLKQEKCMIRHLRNLSEIVQTNNLSLYRWSQCSRQIVLLCKCSMTIYTRMIRHRLRCANGQYRALLSPLTNCKTQIGRTRWSRNDQLKKVPILSKLNFLLLLSERKSIRIISISAKEQVWFHQQPKDF